MKTHIRSTVFVLMATAFVLASTEQADAQSQRGRLQASRFRQGQSNQFRTSQNDSRSFRNAMIVKQGLDPKQSGFADISDVGSPEPRRKSQQSSGIQRTSYQQDGYGLGYLEPMGSNEGYCTTCNYAYESCCCNSRPWWAHRTRVFGEYLYLHASDADVTHGQQQNGIGGAGTVPFGQIGRTDPSYEPGFRVGMDLAINDCSSLFFSYTQFESSTSDFLDIPNITGGGGAVASFVHHPGASITASTGPLNATYDIDFQLADFGVRRKWRAGPRHIINWSVGGRYGHLEQDFLQSGVFSGGAGQIFTRTNVDFDGGGLRFGLDGERSFGCHGFSLYGKTNVSTMVGSVQAGYNMADVNTIQLASAIWKDDRMVTVLDYEVGLIWAGPRDKWRVSAGYNAAHWFNMVTTDSFISAVKANNYEEVDGPLSFSGLVARVERRF